MNGGRIVALREALEWKQKDLARVLKVDIQTVRRWERSIALPFRPGPSDCPSIQNVSSPPVGLAAVVLTAIERAVADCGGRAAELAEVRRRLDLGIGALIAFGCTKPPGPARSA